jgi:hypothetical protein
LTIWLTVWLGVLAALALLGILGILVSWNLAAAHSYEVAAGVTLVVNAALLTIRAAVVVGSASTEQGVR